MQNILLITPFPPNGIGGAETFVKELIKEASKEHEIILCTLPPRRKAWKGTGIRNFSSVFPPLMFYALLTQITRPNQIIHAQGLIAGLIAVLLKKIFKVKVFITLLALYGFDNQSSMLTAVSQWVFNSADIIFVEGENGKRDIRQFRVESKVRIFQHWVDQCLFRPSKYKDGSKIRILFIGRPIPEKGRHIVETAQTILNGKGYEFIYLENTPYKELPRFYQMAHIVVVPSLYAEGFSRVVAEAASCGCALIVSNNGSLPEMCKEFARVIEPTGENLANTIQSMDIESCAMTAYLYAFKNFSPKNAQVFLEEYK